jgi:hypothetical protein
VKNVVNLKQYRKSADCVQKQRAADENAAKFGRTKAQKRSENVDRTKSEKHLDNHKLDDDAK